MYKVGIREFRSHLKEWIDKEGFFLIRGDRKWLVVEVKDEGIIVPDNLTVRRV